MQQGDPLGIISGGRSYIYLTDNSGSVTGISGSCGCSDASYNFTPYGNLASSSAGSGGSLLTQNLIGYTGSLTDTFNPGSTGYIHDGARWYSTMTSAWTSQDTSSYLDNPANGNRYAYAADNPTNNTDPTGAFNLSNYLFGIAATVLTGAFCFAVGAAVPLTLGASLAVGIGCGVALEAVIGIWTS